MSHLIVVSTGLLCVVMVFIALYRPLRIFRINKQLQTELLKTQEDNLDKSHTLANVSHEIRTSMNGILGAAELLMASATDDEQHHYLGVILNSSYALLEITEDILDVSRGEAVPAESETFDLHLLLGSVHQLFSLEARRKGLQFDYNYDTQLPAVWRGDPKRIRQIVTNLISNAIKFTRCGSVSLSVSGCPVSASQYLLNIEVSDTGIGIAPAQIDHIFMAFRQGDSSISDSYGGTGLGLTICHHLARAMGADIRVASSIAKGSTFQLQIPMKQGDDESRKEVITQTDTLEFTGKQVLLVDDNPVNQHVAEKMLEKLGIGCMVASNGEQAIEAVKANSFDCVLMDVHMPVMGGIEATRRIRHLVSGNNVPVLALTASVMEEDQEGCLAAGMNGFVSKPMRLAELRQSLAEHICQV